MFLINGNICGDRVRIGRAMHQPPLTQEQLAEIIRNMEMANMTKMIIYSIEKKERHVCDAELLMLANALNVSMEWLLGLKDIHKKEIDHNVFN